SELLSWVLSCFPHAFRHAVMGGALMPSAIEGMSESMTALGAVSALSSLIPSFSPTTKPNHLFLFRAARSHDLDADLALVEQLTERHNELGLFHPLGFGLFGDDCGCDWFVPAKAPGLSQSSFLPIVMNVSSTDASLAAFSMVDMPFSGRKSPR